MIPGQWYMIRLASATCTRGGVHILIVNRIENMQCAEIEFYLGMLEYPTEMQ